MIFKIIKRIVFAIIIIYSLDLFIRNLDIFIPLNIYTVSVVSILGFPGLITLALSFFFLL
ncbi:MAG: pro-sigmaK processing inhibitor BofA family protein [Bacilli bacterium]|nr:pro-sigmaK processing inhibitor BofA family protein [Bacilli bacterium]MDD3895672.1 pro-sigmaK processing inhibitor BofA family protein [Bacilli bacterium]MDD4407483.1 pro-sigmaK processing inhibitor BofA family protein [Bacilli bacterium]